jgi:fructose-1-phosphate kinase PfkB-like protein
VYFTLSVNPVLDIIFASPTGISEGRQFFAATSISAGGFAANAARTLRCLGESPFCLFLAGGTTGELFTSALRTEGIDCAGLPALSATRMAATYPSRRGPRMLVSPSPAVEEAALAAILQEALQRSTPADVVLAGGSAPLRSESRYLDLLRHLASVRRCCIDVRTSSVDRLIAARPFILKLPSQRERRGRPDRGQGDQLRRAVAGGVHVAVQSFGSRHLLVATEGFLFHGIAPKVKVVNSFGAGDCLVAALVLFLSAGVGVEEAIRKAMAAASASVLTSIPGLFDLHDAQRLEQQTSVRAVGKEILWAS